MTDLNPTQTESDESPVPEGCAALADPREVLLRHIRMAWYDNGVASRVRTRSRFIART